MGGNYLSTLFFIRITIDTVDINNSFPVDWKQWNCWPSKVFENIQVASTNILEVKICDAEMYKPDADEVNKWWWIMFQFTHEWNALWFGAQTLCSSIYMDF